jgi:hypothetical protein
VCLGIPCIGGCLHNQHMSRRAHASACSSVNMGSLVFYLCRRSHLALVERQERSKPTVVIHVRMGSTHAVGACLSMLGTSTLFSLTTKDSWKVSHIAGINDYIRLFLVLEPLARLSLMWASHEVYLLGYGTLIRGTCNILCLAFRCQCRLC